MAYDIQHMKVGDTVFCKIHPNAFGNPVKQCTVTYIHPQCRFFEAVYEINGKQIKESYCPYGKQDD